MYSLMPNGYYVAPDMTDFLQESVAPGYYTVAFDKDRGCFYLSHAQPFTLVKKIYGDSLKHSDRILRTFFRREGINTAAAFEGVKGSGKTLLVKHLSKTFVEQHEGIVLIINTPFHGDAFNSFLQSISQRKIVIFDEFEKVFHEEEPRNAILTLLDGTFASHTLFLITTNTDMYSNSKMEYFSNRPGRVYFNIQFNAVDLSAILEFCKDNLEDLSKIEDIKEFVRKFRIFNMDMLSVLVSEMNLNPDLSLEDLSEYLNIKPDLKVSDISYDFKVTRGDIDVTNLISHQLTPSSLSYFLEHNSNWNLYTLGDDEDDLEGIAVDGSKVKVEPFDVYLNPENSTVTQDPVTRAVTIIQDSYKVLVTPIYTSGFGPKKKISF